MIVRQVTLVLLLLLKFPSIAIADEYVRDWNIILPGLAERPERGVFPLASGVTQSGDVYVAHRETRRTNEPIFISVASADGNLKKVSTVHLRAPYRSLYASAILPTSNESVVVVTHHYTPDGDGIAVASRVSNSGQVIWETDISAGSDDRIDNVLSSVLISDDVSVIAARTHPNNGFTSPTKIRARLIFLSARGEQKGTVNFSPDVFNDIFDVSHSPNGELFILGRNNSSRFFVLAKVKLDGSIEWQKEITAADRSVDQKLRRLFYIDDQLYVLGSDRFERGNNRGNAVLAVFSPSGGLVRYERVALGQLDLSRSFDLAKVGSEIVVATAIRSKGNVDWATTSALVGVADDGATRAIYAFPPSGDLDSLSEVSRGRDGSISVVGRFGNCNFGGNSTTCNSTGPSYGFVSRLKLSANQ